MAARVDKEIRTALSATEGRQTLENMGFTAGSDALDAFAARFTDESRQWKKIIAELNLRID